MSEPEAATTKKRKARDEEQKPAASKKLPSTNETVAVVGDSASANQPNHFAGASCAAAVAATKERKTFEYNIAEYTRPIMEMGFLTSIWNDLLDDNPFYEEEDGERQHYIRNMEQLIRTGNADYFNPFGEDEQCKFLDIFDRLTQHEKEAFLKTAKERKFITMADVRRLFRDPPTRPYYVTLKRVTDKYQDGSQRFPFTSMEDAEIAFIKNKKRDCNEGEYDVVFLDCAPDCKRAECSHPQCKIQVCTKHGLGQGRIYYRYGCGDIVFNFQKCLHCENVVCERHTTLPQNPSTWFRECDICSMGYSAQARVGESLVTGPFPFCKHCGTICKGRVKSDNSDLYNEYEKSECEDTDDSECCGFFCCKNCIDDHQCGYEFQDV